MLLCCQQFLNGIEGVTRDGSPVVTRYCSCRVFVYSCVRVFVSLCARVFVSLCGVMYHDIMMDSNGVCRKCKVALAFGPQACYVTDTGKGNDSQSRQLAQCLTGEKR